MKEGFFNRSGYARGPNRQWSAGLRSGAFLNVQPHAGFETGAPGAASGCTDRRDQQNCGLKLFGFALYYFESLAARS
jgi:hypothetical protein